MKLELEKWLEPYANNTIIHLGDDGEWLVVYTDPIGAPPSGRASAIAGDLVQNLRAALDYVVW